MLAELLPYHHIYFDLLVLECFIVIFGLDLHDNNILLNNCQ